MTILLINDSFYIIGGAEVYFLTIADLLRQKGHKVIFFSMRNPKNDSLEFDKYFVSYFPSFSELTLFQKIDKIPKIFYSFEARKKINALLNKYKPDIVHIHNIWYRTTYSIINEIYKFKIPIVMTLHDYRLVCPNHKMLVNSKLCFKCKNGRYYHAIINKCLGGSLLRSIAGASINYFNRYFLRTYKKINLYISPSKFLIDRFKEDSQFKDIKIAYLPYCIGLDEYSPNYNPDENSIVYFGRLDFEKGIDILIDAVKGLDISLKIIGTGPLEYYLRNKVENEKINNVYFKGFISRQEIKKEISKSLFSVLPSIWHDNFPYSIIESFALGKPVVGSKIGGIPELVQNNTSGLLFQPGNIDDLRCKLNDMLFNKGLIIEMGKNARLWAEENLNYDKHYSLLMHLYKEIGDLR